MNNLEFAQFIADVMKMPLKYELVEFHNTRPGHDLRYGLDGTKLFNLGWKPSVNFEDSLKKTILWTMKEENIKWLD